MVFTKVRKP